ncbi:MAG: hypothetical protein HQ523_08130 [Lentisphaerae bacterium]|nr:hypothetical protein [Lentisphaerota bacterium]
MQKLNVQLCPETGICSIIKEDGCKVDLMPDEVAQLRDAEGDAAGVKRVLAEIDSSFAETLGGDETAQIAAELK